MRCIYCKRPMELVGRLWHCTCGAWVEAAEAEAETRRARAARGLQG